MNILNRPMFSRGDVVSEPFSQELIDYATGLGIDVTGKNSEQITLEINKVIEMQNEQNKPGLVGGKGSILFDYTDPLDYATTVLGATGIGAPAAAYLKSINAARKLKKAYDATSKVAKTPLGLAAVLGGADLATSYDELPETGIPSNISDVLTNLGEKEKEDKIQKEINVVKEESKGTAEKKKKQLDKKRINQEIKNVEDLTSAYEAYKKSESEEYQEERSRKKRRNTDIFLEEMALSMAGTNNLADGLAIGAANAASKVGDADEAEALAYSEFLEKEAEKNAPKDLKETTVMNIIKDYSEQVSNLEGSILLSSKLEELKGMLLDPSKSITGVVGFAEGLRGKLQGAFGQDGKLLDRDKASGIVKFLQARMVQDLLDEKGKTISDADRTLIKELLGNLESTVSNRANIIELLNNVSANLNNSMKEQKRLVRIYDRRYSNRITELDELKMEFNVTNQFNPEIPEDDNEVSVADDPTIIQ